MEMNEQLFVMMCMFLETDHVIRLARRLVYQLPLEDPGRVAKANTISVYLKGLYDRTGVKIYLEEAIRLVREAIEAAPLDHAHRATLLGNLAGFLYKRYDRDGASEDIEEAITLGEWAIKITPELDPKMPDALTNLALNYSQLYKRIKLIGTLYKAIDLAQRAVDMSTRSAPKRATYLNNLAACLSSLYAETNDFKDNQKAAEAQEQALDATPSEDPSRGLMLGNLADFISRRYFVTKEREHLDKAIRISMEAIEKTPEEHYYQGGNYYRVGELFRERHAHHGDPKDFEQAIQYLNNGLTSSSSPLSSRIMAGRTLCLCQFGASYYESAGKTIINIAALIRSLAPPFLEPKDVQDQLGEIATAGSEAASVAAIVNTCPDLAIRILEVTQNVFTSSIEELRDETSNLSQEYPELAAELEEARRGLDYCAISTGPSLSEAEYVGLREQGKRKREAHSRLEQLLVQIRQKTGFEHFMLQPSKEDTMAAASEGPIVIINGSFYGSSAFIIEPHRIQVVHLPLLDDMSKMRDVWRKVSLGVIGMLEWLWDAVAEPVLLALGFINTPPDGKWPNIWWISIGLLSKLPIHAAGYHTDGSSRTVLDRVISTYSLSIQSIIKGRRRKIPHPSDPAKALLVAMKDTPERESLPFAVDEVEMIRDICRQTFIETLEPVPRKEPILANLQDCHIFHFAGHGHTSESNSLYNSLLLEDWAMDPLTVENLLSVNLQKRSPFLAYLSACGTGRITNEKHLNENLHLISACRLAGFRHVIGTLWEVEDEKCLDISRTIYQSLVKDGLTDTSMRKGFHQACIKLRDQWLGSLTVSNIPPDDKSCTYLEAATYRHHKLGRKKRGTRDLDLSDDDDDDMVVGDMMPKADIGLLYWIPYVHFGV
ncbi:MAG: hypothetical protein MMC23_000576 [Stictis urceolatum]|nr:hypothetical protein [Stictis urceolata]